MKTKSFFIVLISFSITIFLSFCTKADLIEPYKIPTFKRTTETTIQDNLGFPSGLSKRSKDRKSTFKGGENTEISGVFIDGPLFLNLWGNGGIQNYENPKVYQFSGTFDKISTEYLAQFDLNEYASDFSDTSHFSSLEYSNLLLTSLFALVDSLWRPVGLTLDGLILNDGSVLVTSSFSEKIFKINSGEPDIYLQNSNLERITGIIQSRDDRIYAAQSPLIIDDNGLKIERPKRVVSIKNNIVTIEFDLPTNIQNSIWQYNSDNTNLSNFERVKIIQNSPAGRKKFGNDFYISDLFENTIYKVDTINNVSVLASGLNYPSSLAIDSAGNLFYTTTPVVNTYDYVFNTEISQPASLCILNPETGKTSVIIEFGGTNVSDYLISGWGNCWITLDKRSDYCIPVNFNVSNVLFESEKELNFLITNSHQRTLKLITLEKE